MQASDGSLPAKRNASRAGLLDQLLVQHGPPHAYALTGGKVRLDFCPVSEKANPAEGVTLTLIHFNTQAAERSERVGHESFAARFVDGRLRAIRNNHVESLLAQRNRRGKTSWTSANDKHIRFIAHPDPSYSQPQDPRTPWMPSASY
jgi:hypothetical protein